MSDWTITWIGDDGLVADLTQSGRILRRGITGHELAPTDIEIEQRFGPIGGATLKGRVATPRRLRIPLHLSANPVRAAASQLAISMTNGGKLAFNGLDQRELRNVIYEAGFEGGGGLAFPGHRFVTVALLALDPWWYGPEATHSVEFNGSLVTTSFDSPTVPFDDPAAPFDGGFRFPLAIGGDQPATPTLAITGPFDTFSLGPIGGDSIKLAAPLAAGETIVIKSDRDDRGPTRNGVVDWSLISPESDTFLLPAQNAEMVGSATGTTAASAVTITWDPRHSVPA